MTTSDRRMINMGRRDLSNSKGVDSNLGDMASSIVRLNPSLVPTTVDSAVPSNSGNGGNRHCYHMLGAACVWSPLLGTAFASCFGALLIVFSGAEFFGGGRQGNQQKKGAPLYLDLEVTLRDLYLGTQIEVETSKQVVCPSCRGSGAKSPDDVVGHCCPCRSLHFVLWHAYFSTFTQRSGDLPGWLLCRTSTAPAVV
jgi:hypothetical protein